MRKRDQREACNRTCSVTSRTKGAVCTFALATSLFSSPCSACIRARARRKTAIMNEKCIAFTRVGFVHGGKSHYSGQRVMQATISRAPYFSSRRPWRLNRPTYGRVLARLVGPTWINCTGRLKYVRIRRERARLSTPVVSVKNVSSSRRNFGHAAHKRPHLFSLYLD